MTDSTPSRTPAAPRSSAGLGWRTRLATQLGAAAVFASALGFAAPAAAEVKVGVSDWPGWVAWYVAEQKGFFKKHGADVKLVWFANYTDSVSALSAGQLDANSQTWSDTLGPLAKGIKLKTILVNDNSAGNDALLVSPKIKSFAELKGKQVALEQYSVSQLRAGQCAGQERPEAGRREDRQLGCWRRRRRLPGRQGRCGRGLEPLDRPDHPQRQGPRTVHLQGHAGPGARPAGGAGEGHRHQTQGPGRHDQGLVRQPRSSSRNSPPKPPRSWPRWSA